MASAHCKSESTHHDTRGKSLPMKQKDISTGSEVPSGQGQKFDVFLSHSGQQKDFIRQLHRDLTNQGVSCFFDQDHDCLPLAKDFPSRILEAINTCQVGILLLSDDFLRSKWPMLELSAVVEARVINPKLRILPLFFLISAKALKSNKENDEKWQMLEISPEVRSKWQEALKAIGRINGLNFKGDEVKFREEIVKEIWHILPMPSPRYHVLGMQGEARMCQEVAKVFNSVQPKKWGVRIVGLYGIAGHGKTTLGKAFCNSCLREFEGKVCYLEFGRGDPSERTKLAVNYLSHSHQLTSTDADQAKVKLHRIVEGKTVLLVLDNITEESMDEVRDYLKLKFGENSWILLSARSREVLERYFDIDRHSCMHVPWLTEDEAIKILLERPFPVEPTLKKEDASSVLNCAKRCSFKGASCDNVRMFHPLTLKAFGSYLISKYGLTLPKWASEIDDVADRLGDGLDEVFAVLGKAFDEMDVKYRTIFMLLTVYILPNMSLDKVIEWMAINCNAKISFIEKGLQDLREKAFIEELEPEIRIHDLYIDFAQRRADKMERWLWWKQSHQYDPRGLISEDKGGFELAKLEHCIYETIKPDYVRNLFVLQFVNVQDMRTVDFRPMKRLRSITLRDCKSLEAVVGMEELGELAWLQIKGVNPMFKLPDISTFRRLRHLEIDIEDSQMNCQLGGLTNCSHLRDISVVCPFLLKVPSFERLSNLTVIKLVKCEIRKPPDLTRCERLQKVYFLSLRNLTRFPNFSLLRKLKTLCLYDCIGVKDPPDIEGCHELQVFHLLYNDNMKGLPKMDKCSQLQEIQVSWRSVDEGIDPDNCQVNGELEFCLHYYEIEKFERIRNVRIPEELKEVQCVKDKTIRLEQYFRGLRPYYSLTSPYEVPLKDYILPIEVQIQDYIQSILAIEVQIQDYILPLQRRLMRVVAAMTGMDSDSVLVSVGLTKEEKFFVFEYRKELVKKYENLSTCCVTPSFPLCNGYSYDSDENLNACTISNKFSVTSFIQLCC